MPRLSRNQKRKKKLAERKRRRLDRDRRSVGDDELLTAMAAVAENFADQMGCEAPRLIERMPEPWCQVADCHANVLKKVHYEGGRAVWGWHFALNAPDLDQSYIGAVFHAVWESPQGDLIDITPQSEEVMACRRAGAAMPLPYFCEDRRYSKECSVEDTGNGLLIFRTVREKFPQRQGFVLTL